MKPFRIFSAFFLMLTLTLGALGTSACTSATDGGVSSTSGSGSSGGY